VTTSSRLVGSIFSSGIMLLVIALKKLNYLLMKTARLSFKLLFFLTLILSVSSCGREDDVDYGISDYNWKDGSTIDLSMTSPLSVSFSADANWTATADSSWCLLYDDNGGSGENFIKILPFTTTEVERTSTVTIKVAGFSPIRFRVRQKPDARTVSKDVQINIQMDNYLRDYYLWNDEYKTLDVNYNMNYQDFLFNNLTSMTTNKLDNKSYGGTYHSLFSFIQKDVSTRSYRSTEYAEKTLEYNFGITGLGAAMINDTIVFIVQGVYHDSPAERAGLKRGTVIKKIDGYRITGNNINDFFYELLIPDSSHKLDIMYDNGKYLSLTSTAMFLNPIIYKHVEEIDGHRIGYLVYNGFDAAFDWELFDVFKDFKSQNITDLVLDLRYNRGGHVMTANLISSCVAGEYSDGKVFASYLLNPARMRALNNIREEELFEYSEYGNLGISLEEGDLGLKHIYCLVTNTSASASELVINSLRGIDVEVTLIGQTTMGKNVGMEPVYVIADKEAYIFAPITFQTFNAKGFGDYGGGFDPDVEIDETNPYGEDGVYYLPRPYGSHNEYLYAEAVKMITGIDVISGSNIRERISYENRLNATKCITQPIYRPGHDGMIKY
jgi:carboxyl-terminal processing protease